MHRRQVHSLKRKVSAHERNIAELADSMAELLATPPAPTKKPMGFITPQDKPSKSDGSARKR